MFGWYPPVREQPLEVARPRPVEAEPNVDVTVTSTDAGGLSTNQLFTLTVTNLLNITDGRFVSASDYEDVTIESGATLELSGDITVSGDWTNNQGDNKKI